MNYIKRKEFLKKCADTFGCCGVTITAIVGIADQCSTTEAVKVVRCKDCKYCHHRTIPNNERYECEYYGCSDEVVDYVEPMHYCSYGERRAENDS